MITVVIPTCGRTKDLETCLEKLLPQIEECDCRLIICDDGRIDDAIRNKYLNDRVRWIQGPGKGPGANRNVGVREADSEWIVFLDDDLVPDDRILAVYKEAIEAGGSDAFEGATLWDVDRYSLLWEAPFNPLGKGHASCNWAIRKSAFEEVGGFDERYVRSQDIEFAARFMHSGYTFVPLLGAVAHHPPRRIPAARKLAQRWKYRALYAFDHGGSETMILWRLPWHAFRIIQCRFQGRAMNGENINAAFIFLQEMLWVIWLTPSWIREIKQSARSTYWKRACDNGHRLPKYGF